MGKIRIKTLGDETVEKKQREEARLDREAKQAKKQAEAKKIEAEKEMGQKAEEVKVTEAPKSQEKAASSEEKKKTVKKKFALKRAQKHGVNYVNVAKLVEKNKSYSLAEALVVLPKLKRAKFDETVELHINTTQAVSGNMTLPHGTGKKMRVAIADDDVIAKVSSGKIDFDILLAQPQMMPKLAKVARILGPKGLMPNPKNGTITAKPEEVAKKYEGGQINFKSEAKFPILHLTVGKLSFAEKKLGENIETAIRAVGSQNIKTLTLKSTMSPGIKLNPLL